MARRGHPARDKSGRVATRHGSRMRAFAWFATPLTVPSSFSASAAFGQWQVGLLPGANAAIEYVDALEAGLVQASGG